MSADQIVLPEGVALDVRSVSPVVRALGWVLDAIAQTAVMVALVFLATAWFGDSLDNQSSSAAMIMVMVLLWVVVPATVETLTRGRSLGKLATGVQVVRDDGGPIRFRHAFVRALAGMVELWMTAGVLAFVVAMLGSRGKRIGDYLAGTYAARVRGAERPLPPLVMPAFLAPWAHAADIRPLPDGLALATRQFIGRAAGLSPASRYQMAHDFAAAMQTYVSPPPPPGTPLEAYLMAVLAERRDREYAIGLAADRRAADLTTRLTRLPHEIATNL